MTIHRHPARVVAWLLALAVTTAGMSSCQDDGMTEVTRAAEQLASALEAGDKDSLVWGGGDLSDTLGPLTDLPRTVELVEVDEPRPVDALAADGAHATLEWSWDLDADKTSDWTYRSTAVLVHDDQQEEWVAVQGGVLPPDAEPHATLTLAHVAPERGDILDRHGEPVVTERPVFRVGIDKTALPEEATEDEVRTAATALAEVAGLGDHAAYADRVIASGPLAFVEAIVVRETSPLIHLADVHAIPGGAAIRSHRPLAPTPTWARPLLGVAGEATAEIIESSQGHIQVGDLVGLSGLQRLFDRQLRGAPGLQVVAQQEEGPGAVLFETEPREGADVELTLDTALQSTAEEALADTQTPAGLVALQPSTGEVLAVASGPGSEGANTAMGAALAPGSTYKMVTALGLLRAGVGPEDEVSCTEDTQVSGYAFHNYPGYPAASTGTITMAEAIAQSCNTALVNHRDHLSPGQLSEAADALGVGQQATGQWDWFAGSHPEDASGTALAAMLIGQGEVLASPMSMATVAASIGAGRRVSPVLVRGSEDVRDQPDQVPGPAAPLTESEAEVLAGYMRDVVTDGGGRRLLDIPGEPVHAKTGSAEAGAGDSMRVDSWMIAFQGDLAVAVLVHSGGYGSEAAGAVVEDFLRSHAAAATR